MSFQNTAGTIIIDAVLTDKGRRYMSQGKFKIEKFVLGEELDNIYSQNVSKKNVVPIR